MNDEIKDLTLLLLYLTSWEEDSIIAKVRRSWKGYPFEILDELVGEGLINGSHGAKPVYLSKEGVEKAQELVSRYLSSRTEVL